MRVGIGVAGACRVECMSRAAKASGGWQETVDRDVVDGNSVRERWDFSWVRSLRPTPTQDVSAVASSHVCIYNDTFVYTNPPEQSFNPIDRKFCETEDVFSDG